MGDFLLWVLAAYGCSSILVRLLQLLTTCAYVRTSEPYLHYQLLLYNSEQSLEAVMRGLLTRSVWEGKSIKVTFVDYGSTDDTVQITSILERNHLYLVQSGTLEAEQMITIDLRKQ